MGSEGWGIIFVLGVLLLMTVLIGLVIWQIFATSRARAAAARDEAYRKLAEQSTSAQQQIAEQQQVIVNELSELRMRVAEMERMLKEVG